MMIHERYDLSESGKGAALGSSTGAGNAVFKKCSNCGNSMDAEDAVCGNCGYADIAVISSRGGLSSEECPHHFVKFIDHNTSSAGWVCIECGINSFQEFRPGKALTTSSGEYCEVCDSHLKGPAFCTNCGAQIRSSALITNANLGKEAYVRSQIRPGDTRSITRDIFVDGQVIFYRGEVVRIDRIDSNPQTLENRYVVTSQLMPGQFLLTGQDLAPPVSKPIVVPPNIPAKERYWTNDRIAIAIIATLVLLGIAIAFIIVMGRGCGMPPAYRSDSEASSSVVAQLNEEDYGVRVLAEINIILSEEVVFEKRGVPLYMHFQGNTHDHHILSIPHPQG